MSISCLLIDMTFISKLLIFLWEISCSILISTKIFQEVYIQKFFIKKDTQHLDKNMVSMTHIFPVFVDFFSLVFTFQDAPISFLVFFCSMLVIIGRSTDPDFDQVFEVPEII